MDDQDRNEPLESGFEKNGKELALLEAKKVAENAGLQTKHTSDLFGGQTTELPVSPEMLQAQLAANAAQGKPPLQQVQDRNPREQAQTSQQWHPTQGRVSAGGTPASGMPLVQQQQDLQQGYGYDANLAASYGTLTYPPTVLNVPQQYQQAQQQAQRVDPMPVTSSTSYPASSGQPPFVQAVPGSHILDDGPSSTKRQRKK